MKATSTWSDSDSSSSEEEEEVQAKERTNLAFMAITEEDIRFEIEEESEEEEVHNSQDYNDLLNAFNSLKELCDMLKNKLKLVKNEHATLKIEHATSMEKIHVVDNEIICLKSKHEKEIACLNDENACLKVKKLELQNVISNMPSSSKACELRINFE